MEVVEIEIRSRFPSLGRRNSIMTRHDLSREERYQISTLLKERLNQSEIALNLGRHNTTISREITRIQACGLPSQTSKTFGGAAIDLLSQWSPEQIAADVQISHETIYHHIYTGKSFGGTLHSHLRCQKNNENAMLAAEIDEDKYQPPSHFRASSLY